MYELINKEFISDPHITFPSSRFPKDIQVGITKRFFLLQSDQVP